jgi:hypothetical protein
VFTGKLGQFLARGRKPDSAAGFSFQFGFEKPLTLAELPADEALARIIVGRSIGDAAGVIHFHECNEAFHGKSLLVEQAVEFHGVVISQASVFRREKLCWLRRKHPAL